jgi:SAM-dependent methyltransferase
VNNTSDIAADRARVEVQEALDRQLAPLGMRAMAALSPMPGERVADIGCGTGQTSLDLAKAVGTSGMVLGIDVSALALATAQHRGRHCPQLKFVQHDAQVYPFEPKALDAAYSRFGVMFFSDPVAAFKNIRRGLKRGGRLAFVCWRGEAENGVDEVPLRAARPFLKPQPTLDPDSPGPFSFADRERVRMVLIGAGFADIEIVPHDEKVGSGELESALTLALRVGSLGKMVREDPALRSTVAEPVRVALAEHDGPDGVMLNAATWIVTARSPDSIYPADSRS